MAPATGPGAPTSTFEAVGAPSGERRGPWAANKRGAASREGNAGTLKVQAGAYSSPATTRARPGR